MQIKLQFSKTSLGLFKVTAAAPAIPRVISPREAVVAQFKNEGKFLDLLRYAELAPRIHALLVRTVADATHSHDGTSCSVEVDLSPAQLELLGLDSVLVPERTG